MSESGLIDRLSAACGRPVSRETFDRIDRYVALLRAAADQQNLVARSSLETLWDRHILDSAQLVRFEPKPGASWLDIGSGAGLPGIVIALLVDGPVTLVEPRRLRVEFLRTIVDDLRLSDRVSIESSKVERIAGRFDVITARAVASLSNLLEISAHLSTRKTVWVFPKGRSAGTELAETHRAWQGTFHLEPSVTGDDSYIVVGAGVGKKS
jgi:16S rRNA (guanine527-N7)-methyltransferase